MVTHPSTIGWHVNMEFDEKIITNSKTHTVHVTTGQCTLLLSLLHSTCMFKFASLACALASVTICSSHN